MALDFSIGDINLIRNWRHKQRQRIEQLRASPHVECISGGCKGIEGAVTGAPFHIGRGFNNQLVLDDPAINPFHAEIIRTPLGSYQLIAASRQAPVYVRQRMRYRPANVIALHDNTRVRLGRHGPVLRYRFLGGPKESSRYLPWLLGIEQDPLIPVRHVQTRLDQMYLTSTLAAQERHFVRQAARHLSRFTQYQRMVIAGATLLTLSIAALVYGWFRFSLLDAELLNAQSRLGSVWQNDSTDTAAASVSFGTAQAANEDSVLIGDRVAQDIRAILVRAGVESPNISIPLVNLVKSAIELEVARLRHNFDLNGFLERYRRYDPRIQEIFQREFQLPPSLSYLAWVESDYQLDAERDAGTIGMWQFSEEAALRYGLITPEGEDFRLDFEASTRGAARFLTDLMTRFGLEQLLVTVLAYHWGPNSVTQLMRYHQLWRPEQRSFSYFLKFDQGGDLSLDDDAKTFVARLIAVQLISENMPFYLGL